MTDLAEAAGPDTPAADRAALLEVEFDRLDPAGNGFIEPAHLLIAINEEEQRRGVLQVRAQEIYQSPACINSCVISVCWRAPGTHTPHTPPQRDFQGHL